MTTIGGDTLEDRVARLEDIVVFHREDLQAIGATASKTLVAVDQLRGDVRRLDGAVGRIAHEQRIMRRDLDLMRVDMVDLRGHVTELRVDVTELRGNVAELRGDVTELRGNVAELRSDVTELRGDMNVVKRGLGLLLERNGLRLD